MNAYHGPERRRSGLLSDDQIDAIAERAATIALEKVYTSIGRSVVSKIMWLLGAAAVALTAWMKGRGAI